MNCCFHRLSVILNAVLSFPMQTACGQLRRSCPYLFTACVSVTKGYALIQFSSVEIILKNHIPAVFINADLLVKSVTLLETGSKLYFERNKKCMVIRLPENINSDLPYALIQFSSVEIILKNHIPAVFTKDGN